MSDVQISIGALNDAQVAVEAQEAAQVVSASLQETQITGTVPGIQGPVGQGVPSGGTTNQVLFKQSNTSYDAVWGFVTSAMIGDLQIVNADVASGAAIELTKLGNGALPSGITITSTNIVDNTIVDADVNASAAIVGTKISPNFGSQNVTTTGTATAAALIPSGSSVPTNGLYLPSANNVAISTNGTGRLFVDASGDVGVGTSSPNLSSSTKALTLYAGISGNNSGAVEIQGSSTTSDGVLGTYRFFSGADNVVNIVGRRGANTNDGILSISTASSGTSTEKLRITSDGKVGLGTSSPTSLLALLHTASTAYSQNTEGLTLRGSSGTVNRFTSLNFDGSGYAGNVANIAGVTTTIGTSYANSAGALRFATKNAIDATPVDRLAITAAGNVGVGTTSPDALLTVNGIGAFGAGAVTTPSIAATGDLNTGFWFPTADTIAASTGGSERARIDSSGRLLVGTSSAETASLGALFQIQATGSSASTLIKRNDNGALGSYLYFGKSRGTAVNSTTIVQSGDTLGEIRFSGADGSTEVGSLAASIGAAVDGTPGANDMPGRLVFSTTADGASSPTERLRITSAGLVGIGTSSPLSIITSKPSSAFSTSTSNFNGEGLHLDGANATAGNGLYGAGITWSRNGTAGTKNAAIASVQTGADSDLGGLAFFTHQSTANGDPLVEALRIDSSGRVGIGTTSPGALLDLAASNDGATGTTANNTLRFTDTDANTAADQPIGKIEWYSADTSSPGARAVSYIMSSAAGANSGGDIRFGISANAGTATEAARIDSSGRLLVGTSSAVPVNTPAATTVNPQFEIAGNAVDACAASINAFTAVAGRPSRLFLTRSKNDTVGSHTVVASGDAVGEISFAGSDGAKFVSAASIAVLVDGTPGADDMPGRLVFSTTADGASSPTERMRITSGGIVAIGAGATNTASVQTGVPQSLWVSVVGSTTNLPAEFYGSSTATRYHVAFSNPNGVVGSISTNASATSYTTSSDYRLKENVTPVSDGITRLQQLKPSRFNFIAEPAKTVDGFIAHEVQSVVPEAITGEKDAVDDEGNPQYQGIDQSKLVPLLTAALQEAVAKIESLEARLTAAGI